MNSTPHILKSIVWTLLLTCCISCSEDSSSPLVEKPSQEKDEGKEDANEDAKIKITAALPKFGNSRLAFSTTDDEGTSSIKINWKESGESFSVIRGGENQTFKQVEGNIFSGILPEKGSGAYYIFYPANSSATNEEAIPFDLSQQNGKMDERKTYMWAILKDGRNITFNHLGTLLKLDLKLPSGGGTLQSVTLKGDALTTKGVFNIVTGKIQATENTTQEININASATEQYVYLPPMPKGWELQLTATTDAGTYTGTIKDESGSTGAGSFLTPALAWKGGGNKLTNSTIASTEVSGSGTAEDPFLISSAEDLLWLRNRANDGICSKNENKGNHYKLTTDISIESSTWTPIGKWDNRAFWGYFDGNNHTISGMLKSAYTETPDPDNGYHFGFFGYVKAGQITNLHLNAEVIGGLNPDSKAMKVGGIVGQFISGSMENCINSGTVKGKGSTAGLVGAKAFFNNTNDGPLKIINCKNSGTIMGGNHTAGITATDAANIISPGWAEIISCTNEGEIIGGNFTGGICSDDDTVDNCINTATVKGNHYVGGIAGGDTNGAFMENCTNQGNVVGTSNVGGITGKGGAKNCINKGDIFGTKNTGGIVGYGSDDILDCINEGTVEGEEYTGGIVGCDEEKEGNKIEHCQNNGTVNGGNYTGGIIGKKQDDDVIDCHNTASITGEEYTGGIAGHENWGIEECTNAGDVTGKGCVGGIAGYAEEIEKCINKGNITGQEDSKGNSYTGGIAGYYAHCNFHSCENYGVIKGGAATNISSTGGLIGYHKEAYSYTTDCINKESGTITPGTGSEVYTGGFFGYAYWPYICKCSKDESKYSENGKTKINGCPEDCEFEDIGCNEYCSE